VAITTELGQQIEALEAQVVTHCGRHPDSNIYLSQPGLGKILSARVLGEFGDAANRYANAKARRNYAGTSPITRASGKKLVVLARYARNKHLPDALFQQAFTTLTASPGARAYYDSLRARPISHNDALRRLSNRLVSIPHGCLRRDCLYDEATAWPTPKQDQQEAAGQPTPMGCLNRVPQARTCRGRPSPSSRERHLTCGKGQVPFLYLRPVRSTRVGGCPRQMRA
jgi:hypothetical protein